MAMPTMAIAAISLFISVPFIFLLHSKSFYGILRGHQEMMLKMSGGIKWPVKCFCAFFCGSHGFFGLGGGVRRYSPPQFSYPTVEEAWFQDRRNNAGDFHRAVCRFESQFA